MNANKHANAVMLELSGHGALLMVATDAWARIAIARTGPRQCRFWEVAGTDRPRYYRTIMVLYCQVLFIHFTLSPS